MVDSGGSWKIRNNNTKNRCIKYERYELNVNVVVFSIRDINGSLITLEKCTPKIVFVCLKVSVTPVNEELSRFCGF